MIELPYNNRNNVLGFIKANQDKTFDELPICFSDMLMMAMLSYTNIEGAKSMQNFDFSRKKIAFKDIVFTEEDQLDKHYCMHNEYKKFHFLVTNAKRYENLYVAHHMTIKTKDPICYLGMMVYLLDNKVFIVFRGTEQSTEAWDEDLQTIVVKNIPSEKPAFEYLKHVLSIYAGKDITILGHSKGGYLSFNSYSLLTKKEKELVKQVVSFDGECSPYENKNYRDEKMIKYVASTDIVGMFFERTRKYSVVKTQRPTAEAHCLFTWILDKKTNYTTPALTDKVSISSEIWRFHSLEFFKKTTRAQSKKWVNFMMDLAYTNETDLLFSIFEDVFANPKKYLTAIKESNHKEKEGFLEVMKIYFETETYAITRLPLLIKEYFPEETNLASEIAYKIKNNVDKIKSKITNLYIDFKVDVNEDRDIKILQLTDFQPVDPNQQRFVGRLKDTPIAPLTKKEKYEKLFFYIKTLINSVEPDLILVTGDIVYGEFDDDGSNLLEIATYLESFKIPWAPVFGNHDNESKKGVKWQCSVFESLENCLFKRRGLTGNGNYNIGIYRNDKLIDVIYMLDSNGCANAKTYSYLENYEPYNLEEKIMEVPGIFEDQVEWINNTASQIGKDVRKMVAMHIAPQAISRVAKENGYQTNDDYLNNETYELDVDVKSKNNDFGVKGERFITCNTALLWESLKKYEFSHVFVGHDHKNNISILCDNIRVTYGVKTGEFDYHKDIGGTLITIDRNNEVEIEQLIIEK